MKRIITLVVFCFSGVAIFAQENAQDVMEKRAREMYRVITSNDREQWRKFIKENYSQTLIDKPMRKKIVNQDDGGTQSETKTTAGNLEDKVNMFQNLHRDFAESQIASIKKVNQTLEMILSGGGTEGTFKLKFSDTKPYLIEGLGIELTGGPR
jgi:hypothetical protein